MINLHFKRGILPLCEKVLRQEAQGWLNETINVIAIPLTFFLAFGLGLRSYIKDIDGTPYLEFIMPGLISMTILLEAYRTGAWGMWLDRWHQGMLNEYRIKPITTSDIIIGQMLGGFIVALLKGSIVAATLFLLTPVTLNWQHLGPYMLFMLSGSMLFTCVGTMVGSSFPKPDQIAQTQTIFITPLLYLGGVFFPIHAFPDWLVPIVSWLPTTAVFEGGRTALLNGTVDVQALVLVSGFAILSFMLATYSFNKKLSE